MKKLLSVLAFLVVALGSIYSASAADCPDCSCGSLRAWWGWTISQNMSITTRFVDYNVDVTGSASTGSLSYSMLTPPEPGCDCENDSPCADFDGPTINTSPTTYESHTHTSAACSAYYFGSSSYGDATTTYTDNATTQQSDYSPAMNEYWVMYCGANCHYEPGVLSGLAGSAPTASAHREYVVHDPGSSYSVTPEVIVSVACTIADNLESRLTPCEGVSAPWHDYSPDYIPPFGSEELVTSVVVNGNWTCRLG